jgi:hypothetical protein
LTYEIGFWDIALPVSWGSKKVQPGTKNVSAWIVLAGNDRPLFISFGITAGATFA